MSAETLKPAMAYNERREISKAVLPPAIFVSSIHIHIYSPSIRFLQVWKQSQ